MMEGFGYSNNLVTRLLEFVYLAEERDEDGGQDGAQI
jgi:hypothetical protein